MDFGDRLGLSGLIMAFVSIALFYLVPTDRKWIGWVALLIAVILGVAWLYFERNPRKETTPNFLVPHEGFYVSQTEFKAIPGSLFWSLHLKFKNNPTTGVEAKGVSASIRFYDSKRPHLFEMPGRWADDHYPTANTPKGRIEKIDFGVGQTRDLDIALKYPDDLNCYGVNNDSWESIPNDLRLPKYQLVGEEFAADVVLTGNEFIESKWKVRFRNLGKGSGLKAISCHSV